jgi:hypothetical protein
LHVPASESHAALQQSPFPPHPAPDGLQQRLVPPSTELQLPLQQSPLPAHPLPLSLQQVPASSQLWPEAQPFVHATERPQLLVAVPEQRPLHAVPSS